MYHGKVIYNPSGKAGEYSAWAANFYNGCSAKCEYCYNRHGRSEKIVGCDVPILKKSLINEQKAIEIFQKEAFTNLIELQKNGLFFNFVSDPCLPETIQLNFNAIRKCYNMGINVKLLTKQTWWLSEQFIQDISQLPENISFGFTLTGHDELEPGAATNHERIEAIRKLHEAGFKTWASIEPIIDINSTWKMVIECTAPCNLMKIGLQSGKKYDKKELLYFIEGVLNWSSVFETKVYFKDSILKAAGIYRENLPSNCVNRDFNL